jgi:hypothetical protein
MINISLLSHIEKLLVAQVEMPFVVKARIEPSTFRLVSQTVYQLSYPARQLSKRPFCLKTSYWKITYDC